MAWWRGALGLLIVVSVLALVFIYSDLPRQPAQKSVSGRMLNSGIYSVGDIDYRLIDTERATASNGDFVGLEHRELDTRVWYPSVEDGAVAPGRHPLLVYSHGYSSSKLSGAYLADYMARQGYIVVAADFPLSHMGAPGGATVVDVVNQPGDVSFLIDTLLAWDADIDSPFFERVDTGRIGALGTSLGGMTSTLVAYHPRWRDPRVKLAISIAGPSSLFGARFFDAIELPFLMVATDADPLVNYSENALPILDKVPGAILVSIDQGSHTGFSGLSRYIRWMANPDAIACRYVERELQQQPMDAAWYQLVGDAGEGIVAIDGVEGCVDLAPTAINPVLQQRITVLSVANFIQQRFALTGVEIAAARNFLFAILPREFAGVQIETATAP